MKMKITRNELISLAFAGKKSQEKQLIKMYLSQKSKANDGNLERILKDYPYSFAEFCEKYIKIQNKAGIIVPFMLNEWQAKTYNFILEKYKHAGQIDILIVKGRQGGMTTFAVAFLLYQMLGLKCNISFISQNFKNASNIYGMFERAVEGLKISTSSKNSGHKIGIGSNLARFYTAEGDNIRGSTLLGLLNDELGERNDVLELQALAKIKGMVHFKIGTPKGIGNNLYLQYVFCKENRKLDNVLFLPWHHLKEYESHAGDNFEIFPEIEEYLAKHDLLGLPIEKKAWLQERFNELKASCFNPFEILNQEYPPNIDVGFEATADNCFVEAKYINYAFGNQNFTKHKDVIIGIDIAGGGDKSIACFRFGKRAEFIELKHKAEAFGSGYDFKAEQLINALRDIGTYNVLSINVDSTGQGINFVDILKNKMRNERLNYNLINAVHFGSRVEYKIKSGEIRKRGVKEDMYFRLREWLMEDSNLKASIQPLKVIQEELLATEISTRDGEEFLITKEKIKEKINRSPDFADALALTFAPVKQKIYFSLA